MSQRIHRRGFLRRAATGGRCWDWVGFRFCPVCRRFPLPRRDWAPGTVPLLPDMEPLVRLLEDTPRERLLKVVGARVRRGLAPTDSGRLAAGRGTEHPAAPFGRVQVPCRPGSQLGLSGRPFGRRCGSLVGPVLGARLLQGLAGPRHAGRRLEDEAGGRSGLPVAPKTRPAFRGDGYLGRGGGDAAVAAHRTAGSDPGLRPALSVRRPVFRSIGHKASGTVKLPWARRWLTFRAKDRRRISWKRLAVWFCSRAMIPTTTSSVWRPWKTITMSRPPGAIAFWRPAYFSCEAREGKT